MHRRRAHSRTRRPVASQAPCHRVGARQVREQVLVLGVVLPVHLGCQRPRGNPAVPRAPCVSPRCGRALRVGSVSQLDRVGPDLVLEWAKLAGHSKSLVQRRCSAVGRIRP
jgi:hypothetical protein